MAQTTQAVKWSYRPRVIVKFRDNSGLPYDDSALDQIEKMGLGPAKKLAEKFPGLKMVPLFRSKTPAEIEKLVEIAKKRSPDYRPPDFLSYFAVSFPEKIDPAKVAEAFSSWDSVDVAYVEPPPVEPPAVDPSDDGYSYFQQYLDPAPDGIDAHYAWGFPGGDGAGQSLVDLERGWTFNHEDLADHGISLISGINDSHFSHGTAVLGAIAAVDNAIGMVGIVPHVASVRCVSQWRGGGVHSTSEAIMDVLVAMKPGDVLLLEAQTDFDGYVQVPVEIEPAVYDEIELATALKIVVVEAAGNGGVDLDTIANSSGQLIFDRTVRDSGAIFVGAAGSFHPHARLSFSCYGSCIDCYGWGENVATLLTDHTGTVTEQYRLDFNGTSSASAIVAGAALAVQGLAEANLGQRFSPKELRDILSDPAYGTPSHSPADDRIGVMPNLKKFIDKMILNPTTNRLAARLRQ
ncbi:MAG TPA: S8 family peptidase [Planctomycetaceae bacterium]|nr:S8 family peptidase [Planctomycetaceae bacterium]